MIFYFSATGNSRYAAERIAAVSGDRTESIADRLRKGYFQCELKKDEQLGFVTPVYFQGLPDPVRTFLARLEVSTQGRIYTWHVATCGRAGGAANRMLSEMLAKRGIYVNAFFAVRMPDTWTPVYDLSDRDAVRETLARAEKEIDRAAGHIAARDGGDFNRHKGLPLLSPVLSELYRRTLSTKRFTVQESCISCGICAAVCPSEVIRMKNMKPSWTEDSCAFCLGCLHSCPVFAIQYGKHTERHGQYRHPGAGEEV